MSKIAVVYHSGYGHTKVIAETFANENVFNKKKTRYN